MVIGRPKPKIKTYFYTYDIEQVRRVLKKLKLMKHGHLVANHGKKGHYVIFNKCLTDEQCRLFRNSFIEKDYKKKYSHIDGFEGCLITGSGLKYTYKGHEFTT